MITSFQGDYRFLSNFWPAAVKLDGELYASVEHAYVAAKTLDSNLRLQVKGCSAGQAKRMGHSWPVRSDWEDVKVGIMEGLLRQKFSVGTCRRRLLATEYRLIIEGNRWGDVFWGVNAEGSGKNVLGLLLMRIRDELRGEQMVSGIGCVLERVFGEGQEFLQGEEEKAAFRQRFVSSAPPAEKPRAKGAQQTLDLM